MSSMSLLWRLSGVVDTFSGAVLGDGHPVECRQQELLVGVLDSNVT